MVNGQIDEKKINKFQSFIYNFLLMKKCFFLQKMFKNIFMYSYSKLIKLIGVPGDLVLQCELEKVESSVVVVSQYN